MLAALALQLGARAGFAIRIGDPMPGLTADERGRFATGRTAFEAVETPEDGLGPVFNGDSCAACHNAGATGGGSALVETRFGTRTNGVFDPMPGKGGSLIQTTGIGVQGACNFVGEVVPPEANVVAGRRTTPLFGLGLVDAVPDEAFVALARREARFTPQTAGRPNMVANVVTGGTSVGKFGWKSQVPSLLQFSGDAYLNEMGVTTPMFPDENCPQGNCALLACDPVPGTDDADLEDVDGFHDFMSMLAPPAPVRTALTLFGGEAVFEQVGCESCHVRTLKSSVSDVPALSFKTFRPYSDFLLHDMGALGDGIPQGQATGREMRTAPLWGLHLMTTYLHDGRATTIRDAILAHDGQGRAARNRFAALSTDRQLRLIAFLKSL